MSKLLFKLLTILNLILLTSCCGLSKPNPQTSNQGEQLHSILQHPGFTHLKSTLKLIIEDKASQPDKSQHFFITKYKAGSTITYMFWKEQQLLWIMPLGNETEESWLGIRHPSGGQLIDIKKDVVATHAEIGSSTYLVSQAWVVKRMHDAVINGDLITLN